jgi:hypothetical protein
MPLMALETDLRTTTLSFAIAFQSFYEILEINGRFIRPFVEHARHGFQNGMVSFWSEVLLVWGAGAGWARSSSSRGSIRKRTWCFSPCRRHGLSDPAELSGIDTH